MCQLSGSAWAAPYLSRPYLHPSATGPIAPTAAVWQKQRALRDRRHRGGRRSRSAASRAGRAAQACADLVQAQAPQWLQLRWFALRARRRQQQQLQRAPVRAGQHERRAGAPACDPVLRCSEVLTKCTRAGKCAVGSCHGAAMSGGCALARAECSSMYSLPGRACLLASMQYQKPPQEQHAFPRTRRRWRSRQEGQLGMHNS